MLIIFGSILLLMMKTLFEFALIASLVLLVCLGFGFEWSWLLSLGVWALMILLRGVFKDSSED